LITSGDIQYGVPTNVFFFADNVPDNCPETPKSASFTSPPAERRIFAATARIPCKAGGEKRHGWFTFDVTMQFAFCMEVIQSAK